MDERRELAATLEDARARTLALVEDLTDAELRVPYLRIVNPFVWELGHVAWFQERWMLRHVLGAAPLRADSDALYDSAKVAHATRWHLPLPSRAETLAYMRAVLERSIESLLGRELTDDARYFAWLAIFHEDMHGEAFTYTRQTLGLRRPPHARRAPATAGPLPGDVDLAGGRFLLGAAPGSAFVFDNEKWAHEVEVAPFRIARAATTQRDLAEFTDDGGYARRELWSEAGWSWRAEARAVHPLYWRKDSGGWLRRDYDRWIALEDHRPALHVNLFEAEAYCRWKGRRLPTEAEWELAAAWDGSRKRAFPWGNEHACEDGIRAALGGGSLECSDVGAHAAGDSACGARQMLGNVWEWTASDFLPFPSFVRDPYAEYSEPWFGTHKVLRGGCIATRARLLRNTWRNFYTPDRRDVFAGFRTAADAR